MSGQASILTEREQPASLPKNLVSDSLECQNLFILSPDIAIDIKKFAFLVRLDEGCLKIVYFPQFGSPSQPPFRHCLVLPANLGDFLPVNLLKIGRKFAERGTDPIMDALTPQ